MIHTKKITLFLFSLLFLSPIAHLQAGLAPIPSQKPSPISPAQMAPGPSSEQDMSQIVQELEKATKEIDNFVKALPAEEQAEFNRIVQQVESKMSQTDPAVLERFLTNQMNPEELDQFLGNVFEGINPPEFKPAEEGSSTKTSTEKRRKSYPKRNQQNRSRT